MALQLRGVRSRKARTILGIAAVFITAVPLLIGLERTSHALNAPAVVVNEFSASGSKDWVELYNTTDQAINLDGWQLKDDKSKKILTGTVGAHGYLVVDLNFLNQNEDAFSLLDNSGNEIDTVAYATTGPIQYAGPGQSTGRIIDGGSTWAVAAPTKGSKNDVTAPGVPVILTPTNGAYIATAPIENSWTAVGDPSGIANYEVEYIYDDGHTFANGPTRLVPGTQTHRNHQPNVNEQGGVTIRVRAIDGAGNRGAYSAPVHYIYDVTPPKLDVRSPAEGQIFGKDQTLEVTSVISDNIDLQNYYIRMDDSEESRAEPDSSNPQLYSTKEVRLMIIARYQTNDLSPGSHTLTIGVRDGAGHITETTRTIVIDKEAPTLAFASPVQGVVIDKTKRVTISGTASDDATSVSSVRLRLSKKEAGICSESYLFETVASVVDGSWRLDPYGTKDLASGEYCLMATAEDNAGKVGIASTNFYVDNNAPEVTIGLVTSATPTASTPVILSGHISEKATLRLLLNGQEMAEQPEIAIDDTGNWRAEIGAGLSQGSYVFTVEAMDEFGNAATASGSVVMTVGALATSERISPDLTARLDDPFNVPSILGATTPPALDSKTATSSDVLGAASENGDARGEIMGATVAPTTEGWKLFGIAWYWWLSGTTIAGGMSWAAKLATRRRLGRDVL